MSAEVKIGLRNGARYTPNEGCGGLKAEDLDLDRHTRGAASWDRQIVSSGFSKEGRRQGRPALGGLASACRHRSPVEHELDRSPEPRFDVEHAVETRDLQSPQDAPVLADEEEPPSA
jgi:hypothetical protein